MNELEEGRAADAWIAEHVMGYTDVHHVAGPINGSWWGNPPAPCQSGTKIPYYTTDLDAALEVFLVAAGEYDPPLASIFWAGDRWVVQCGDKRRRQAYAMGAHNLPLAICRAAANEYADRIEVTPA